MGAGRHASDSASLVEYNVRARSCRSKILLGDVGNGNKSPNLNNKFSPAQSFRVESHTAATIARMTDARATSRRRMSAGVFGGVSALINATVSFLLSVLIVPHTYIGLPGTY